MPALTDRAADTAPPRDEPVTVTVARRVARGREAELEEWLAGVLGTAARWPGYLGGGVLRPGRPGEEWHVVFRFDSAAHWEAWAGSDERRDWLERGEELAAETGVSRVTGLETWFALPGRTAPAPPRWKMWIVTLTAILPLVLLMNVLVQPHLEGWPLVLRALVFSGTLTLLMTYVVMPRLTGLLRGWLYPRDTSSTVRR